MIGSREAKDDLYDEFARVGAALSSGRRLEIVDVLAQAPRTVERLAEAIDQSVANTSHHLRRLAEDGLVRTRRQGRHIVYQLASDEVYGLWQALQELAARHHEQIEQRATGYVGDRSQIEVIDHETLRRRLDKGENLILIDVRPEEEYVAGHIEGAISAPPDRLDQILPSLPRGQDIVAYCRGEYCAFADQAVRHLLATGRTAYRLALGYREWSGLCE